MTAETALERAGAAEDEALAAACDDIALLISASERGAMDALARRVHAASARHHRPFVSASAAALPREPAALVACCRRLQDSAAGGSLLLGEIERMPADIQDRFLDLFTALQNDRAPAAATRLVAGTTVRLYDRVVAGTFSERLFYRLNVIHLVG